MLVQVIHRIQDWDGWGRLMTQAAQSGPPPGFSLRSTVTTQGHDTAFCLWEGESVAALSGFLDQATKGIAANEYNPIDAGAIGHFIPAR